MVQVKVADVVIDEDLYPRQKVNDQHARAMVGSLEAGYTLPPIILDSQSMVLVDGRHRLIAHQLLSRKTIEATLKRYAERRLLFEECIALNAVQGLSLSSWDRIRAAQIGFSLGLTEDSLAKAMRTSIEHLRAISTRYATVADAESDMPNLRRVALKASMRHLVGRQITQAQMSAIDSAPGQSYLLLVRQVIDGINFELLPPVENNPKLYKELRRLRDLLTSMDLPEELEQPI